MVKVRGTALREIIFADCKILGVRFDECNAFGFSAQFVRNQLDHASFFQLKMNGTIFSHCRLRETDFTETELNGAVFEACDLEGAVFDHTQLQKADFRSAHGFVIDPETNDIRKAKFSPQGLIGLLHKYGIEVL